MRTVRTYFRILWLLLVLPAVVLVTSCLKDEPFKRPYEGFQPVSRTGDDGWVISTPEDEAMDRALVDAAYQLVYKDTRFTMARSLLVIRNGKLVAEAYPHEAGDMDRIANIQSMTKSFTSVLAGIALKQHLLDSVDQTFYSICPEWFTGNPDKKDITLKHALTMTTGIDFNNDEDTQTLYQSDGNSAEFVLSRPKAYEPGIVFHYHDGSPHLVAGAIQKRSGMTLSEFARQNLFTPLGITDWKWEAAHDGVTFGAFSLFLKPRDCAKFGQLLLRNGTWNGQPVVDSTWIAAATQPLVNTHIEGAPYGYFFWVYPAFHGFAADGHGGQKIMVIPEKNLVIVYTAWGYTSGDFFDNFNELADLILKSCH
jgi:CubicO group peptidase (beta-lactamase class C family)